MDKLPNNPNQPESCGTSVAEHFNHILMALAVAGGVGIRCPEAYEALVEFVEGFRLAGNHDRIEPSENGLGREFADRMVAYASDPQAHAQGLQERAQRVRDAVERVKQRSIGKPLSGSYDPKDYKNRN